jgi:ABC-type uncharacterized transport system permease subunit
MSLRKFREALADKWKTLAALALAVLIGWIILLFAGYDAAKAFSALWGATFDNLRVFSNTINKASPLLFTGLAVAISYRASVFNIGAEGQFLLGATLSAWVGFTFTDLPGFILIFLMILAGAAGGAIWALIPGWLKARHGVSEIITTIMFNHIALKFVGFLVRGPFKDTSQAQPQSFPVARQAYLPTLLSGTRLHMGFFAGVVFAVILFIYLFKTYYGYEVRAVGQNALASKVGGIKVTKTMIVTMLLSGALAGIGGALEVAGNTRYLLESISPGYGYTAIAVSVLAENHPIGIIATSFLFGLLNSGATAMQREAHVSADFVNVFQGMIIMFIAVAAVKKLRPRSKAASYDGGGSVQGQAVSSDAEQLNESCDSACDSACDGNIGRED